MRHPFICNKNNSALIVIDVQKALEQAISEFALVKANSQKLVTIAQMLGIPCVVTEQNSSKLGKTVLNLPENTPTIEKLSFSACMEGEFIAHLKSLGVNQLVVAGTEAHVCVLQTCLDLLHLDFDVFILTDAIASREPENKKCAIEQLSKAGAVATTLEMVVFQWLEKAATEEFRKILPIIK